jgi:hypothetical protein
MSFLENIDVPERRTDRKTCPYCEASAAGCRSNAWLRPAVLRSVRRQPRRGGRELMTRSVLLAHDSFRPPGRNVLSLGWPR